jgi:AraC family transcriptional regulator
MPASRQLSELPPGGQLGRVVRRRTASDISFVEALYGPDARLAMHRHADPHFCFVLAGSVEESTPDRSYTYGGNTLLFRAAGEVHAQRYGTRGARCFSFFLPLEWTETRAFALSPSVPLDARGHSNANSIVRRMYDEFRRPDAFAGLALEGLTLELLAERSRSVVRSTSTSRWLADARDALDQMHVAAPTLRLSDLAAQLGVNPGYLVKTFRREYGLSPAAFLRRRRLQWAYTLVVETDRKFGDIATAAGYFDQSHFTRAFVATYGVTPSSCRRSTSGASARCRNAGH